MKLTTTDLLAILWLFEQATDNASTKDITQVARSHPSSINTCVSFRFKRTKWSILVDDTAEDHEFYVVEEITKAVPNSEGFLIENPQLPASFGVPYEGKDIYLFQHDDGKHRLDYYLASTKPEFSRSSWQKHIKAGRVQVDEVVVTSPRHNVTDDSSVVITLPESPNHDEKSLPIVYIDDDVVVVDKPVGVLTHRKNQLDDEFTVADFFRRYTTHGLETDRPGIVHRLDRDTSGLIIGARTDRAYEHLKQQFANREAKKVYVAVVEGQLKQHEVRIDLPIQRNPAQPGSYRVDMGGKSAQTIVSVLHKGDDTSLVRLRPLTGRTHQLRVHMSHLGNPILGDRLYGRQKQADRLYLHAHALTLALPSGQLGEFIADIPQVFYVRSGAVNDA